MSKPLIRAIQAIHEAAEWNQRLQRGALSADERREYNQWLEDPRNAEELGRACIIDVLLSQVSFRDREDAPDNHVRPDNVIDFESYAPLCRLEKEVGRFARQPPPLCMSYLASFRKDNSCAKVVLVAAAFFAVLLSTWMDVLSIWTAATCMGFLGLIFSKEAILRYRITRGLFGTTESEVRDLIGFILKDCGADDFTDDQGRRMPAFAARPQDENVPAETLPHGVTAK